MENLMDVSPVTSLQAQKMKSGNLKDGKVTLVKQQCTLFPTVFMLAFQTYFYDHISVLPAISSLACSSPLASLFILQGCLILFLLLP